MSAERIEWTLFSPSQALPRERVTIAYATHDERGVRYAYGYFQFNPANGKLCGFMKDGNKQPRRVRTEDILYWMPIPPLRMKKEQTIPVDAEKAALIRYPHVTDPKFDREEALRREGFAVGVYAERNRVMRQAVDGEIVKDISGKLAVTAKVNLDGFKFGEKVSVIIIKKEK